MESGLELNGTDTTATLAPRPSSPPPYASRAEEYGQRRDQRRDEVAQWQKRRDRIGLVRLALIVIAGGLLWLMLERWLSAWWLALPFVGILLLTPSFAHAGAMARRARRAMAWYEQGLARLQGAAPGPDGLVYLRPDHPYSGDLDLFGPGNLFPRLCTARTRAGRDLLAGWLLEPASLSEADERRAAAAELAPQTETRERLALAADVLSHGVDTAGLLAWSRQNSERGSGSAEHSSAERGSGSAEPQDTIHPDASAASRSAFPLPRSALWLFVVLTNLALLAWFAGWTSPKPFAWLALGQGCVALALRGRVQRALAGLHGRSRDLLALTGLMRTIEAEPFESPRLRQLQASLQSEGVTASDRLDELARIVTTLDAARNGIFALTIGPLTLWTTRAGLAVEEWRRIVGPAVPRWLDAVGEIEALASLASWAAERPDDCQPELFPAGTVLEAEQLRHPLLPPGKAVANDVHVNDHARLVIVSGSNMSGKSTYLRAIGLAVVLARAGAVVPAARFRLSDLAIGASLRATDSVLTGESRFAAELSHLRRVADLAASRPTLFLLDELLHGTNSHDRRAGATAILRGLLARGAVGLVTTHDLALTQLADELTGQAVNIHFADDWHDGELTFDYRLRPGVVQRSNALALLRAVGLLDDADL